MFARDMECLVLCSVLYWNSYFIPFLNTIFIKRKLVSTILLGCKKCLVKYRNVRNGLLSVNKMERKI